jgi:hypothetical protein
MVPTENSNRKTKRSALKKCRQFTALGSIIFIITVFLLLACTLTSRNSLLRQKSKPENGVTIGTIPPPRACRVRVENKVDFNYEVLESLVLRFELPWHQINCDIKKPITFDFALYQNMFHPNIGNLIPGKKNARFLNETEYWSWKRYFEKSYNSKRLIAWMVW